MLDQAHNTQHAAAEAPQPRASQTRAKVDPAAALEAQAAAVIGLYAAAKAAEHAYQEARKPLLARMMREGLDGLTVPGVGKVATVAASESWPVDSAEAERLLVAAGIAVPRKRKVTSEALRVTPNA